MDDKTLLSLVEKFGNSDMSELELNDGTINLVLRKGTGSTAAVISSPAGTATAPSSVPSAVHLALHGKPEAASGTPGGEAITSPIVGTFYRASGPDTPAFAEPGKK
jgi:acetyl-CoA carboxylase biotin carboxyl carrier protein